MLLGEIIGNQIDKNAIFYVKKVFFFYKQPSLQSLHGFFDQKTPENPQKMVEKRVEIQYFWKIHDLK